MKTNFWHKVGALALFCGAAASSGCNLFRSNAVTHAACPEIGAGRDALGLNFSMDARANAKVRTFVQAANDISGVAGRVEWEVSEACRRIGFYLGLAPAAMMPRQELGGRASGACAAVAQRIDQMMRAGISLQVSVTPPVCQASAEASARCGAACGGNGGDAECQASCRSHAAVHGSCTPAMVMVRSNISHPDAARLVNTLQANLPALLHAEVALARRLQGDAQTVVQVGGNLPKIVGQAGVHALGCIAAGADEVGSASVQMNVSIRASIGITGRVGATSG